MRSEKWINLFSADKGNGFHSSIKHMHWSLGNKGVGQESVPLTGVPDDSSPALLRTSSFSLVREKHDHDHCWPLLHYSKPKTLIKCIFSSKEKPIPTVSGQLQRYVYSCLRWTLWLAYCCIKPLTFLVVKLLRCLICWRHRILDVSSQSCHSMASINFSHVLQAIWVFH